MKIIRDTEAYIQLDDIITIKEAPYPIPVSIIEEVFRNGALIVTDANRFEFVRFVEPEQIEFLSRLDYLVDYDEVKELETKEDFITFAKDIQSEQNSLAQSFCELPDDEKEKNKEMLARCNLLEKKVYSIRDVLWFCQGKIPMTLPDGINPLSYKRTAKESIKRMLMKVTNKKDVLKRNHKN